MIAFFVCAALVATATANCHGDAASVTPMPGAYIPQCEVDGTYKPTQCHSSTGYCWCATETGDKIHEPIFGGLYEECHCIRHKFVATNGGEGALIGAYVPQCQGNGKYEPMQCWASTGTCWCVTEVTGEHLTEAVGPGEHLEC